MARRFCTFPTSIDKQSGGIPQAIYDMQHMLDESGKERIIDKRKVMEMRHEAGVNYFDFTSVVTIIGVVIVSMRYIGMGTGDMTLYIMVGNFIRYDFISYYSMLRRSL